jgi:rRNA maturation RNase YbeY
MNVIQVEVVKAVRAPVRPAFVRSVLSAATRLPEIAARLPVTSSNVAVRITGDEEMRRLNRAYAGEDHATDVLSFEGSGEHLGDLAISWPAVERQAREHGHGGETELALLCVHGLLHLLGWDHSTGAENMEMTRVTKAALALSGVRLSARRL